MSSLLEERYRRALRLLPADFRRGWEDDMVATFMDRAYRSMPDDPEGVEISSPRWPELVSVARLALRLRFGGAGSVPGEVVRRVALVGLLAHAVFAISGVALSIWFVERTELPGDGGFAGWWQAMWTMSQLLWVPAYLAVLFGHRRVAAITAAATFGSGAVGSLLQLSADHWARAPLQIEWLIFGLLPVLALAGFHGGAPAVRARPWVVALPIGVTLVCTAVLLGPDRVTGTWLWAFGIVAAGLVTIVVAIRRGRAGRGRARMSPTWPVTLALYAVAILGLDAASGGAGLRTVGLGVTGVLLAAVAAWSRDRSDPAGATPDADRPRQEPGPATTVER
jgi:hypothetical protein